MRYAIFTALLATTSAFGLASSASAQQYYNSSGLSSLLQTATNPNLVRPVPNLPQSANNSNLNSYFGLIKSGYLVRPIPQLSPSANQTILQGLLNAPNFIAADFNRLQASPQVKNEIRQYQNYLNSLPPAVRINQINNLYNFAIQGVRTYGNSYLGF
jgi:hypothetical protein